MTDNTQWICTTEEGCLCTPEEYSCDCEPAAGYLPANRGTRICGKCRAPMRLIDADTGLTVQP